MQYPTLHSLHCLSLLVPWCLWTRRPITFDSPSDRRLGSDIPNTMDHEARIELRLVPHSTFSVCPPIIQSRSPPLPREVGMAVWGDFQEEPADSDEEEDSG